MGVPREQILVIARRRFFSTTIGKMAIPDNIISQAGKARRQ